MKILIAPVALVLGPLVIFLVLSRLPAARRLSLAALILLVTVLIDFNLGYVPEYRGMSRGFDIGLLDIATLGVFLYLVSQARRLGFSWRPPRAPGRVSPVVGIPHGLPTFLVFVAIAALSLLEARNLTFGLMDLSKLLRGVFLFWVVVNLIRDDDIAERLPYFLALFVGLECLLVASQHVRGIYMPSGTFEHKNSMAMALNLVLPTILIYALSGRRRMLLMLLLYGGGALAVILSRSRTGWFTLLGGGMLIVAVSFARAFALKSRRRMRSQLTVLAIMAALAVPVLAKSADGIIERYNEDSESSMDFRHKNNEIAETLAGRNVFGVGLNNYVAELDQPVGKLLAPIDKTVAHHLYLLVAAETGWVGLSTLVLALVVFWIVGLRTALSGRTSHSRDVTLGLLTGLLTCHLHSFLESDMLRTHTFFIVCILLGMLVGLHQREGLGGVSGALRALRDGVRSSMGVARTNAA